MRTLIATLLVLCLFNACGKKNADSKPGRSAEFIKKIAEHSLHIAASAGPYNINNEAVVVATMDNPSHLFMYSKDGTPFDVPVGEHFDGYPYHFLVLGDTLIFNGSDTVFIDGKGKIKAKIVGNRYPWLIKASADTVVSFPNTASPTLSFYSSNGVLKTTVPLKGQVLDAGNFTDRLMYFFTKDTQYFISGDGTTQLVTHFPFEQSNYRARGPFANADGSFYIFSSNTYYLVAADGQLIRKQTLNGVIYDGRILPNGNLFLASGATYYFISPKGETLSHFEGKGPADQIEVFADSSVLFLEMYYIQGRRVNKAQFFSGDGRKINEVTFEPPTKLYKALLLPGSGKILFTFAHESWDRDTPEKRQLVIYDSSGNPVGEFIDGGSFVVGNPVVTPDQRILVSLKGKREGFVLLNFQANELYFQKARPVFFPRHAFLPDNTLVSTDGVTILKYYALP